MHIKSLFLSLFLNFAVVFSSFSQSKSFSDTIDILNYNINLKLINLSQKTISGFTKIHFTPRINQLQHIKLDLLKLNIDSIYFENNPLTSFTYNDTLIRITLPNPLNIDDTTDLTIYYHGSPQKDASGWGGFYFSNDSAYAYNLGVGFEAVPHNFGRVWFPCIDDFVDRATYDYYITVKNDKMAVCGGTLISVVDNGDNTSTYHWRLHSEIPTYLSSMAVGPYEAVNDTFQGINGKIPINIYVSNAHVNKVPGTFLTLKQILEIFEQRYGPYLWERVGYVGVPFNSGAMEHATNIAYPNFAINGNLSYESLFAHELSHHWFGDLITCSTAGDMWINEGWARYSEAIYRELLYGVNSYKDFIRNNHLEVVRSAHIIDDGYRALYGIPDAYTYSTTVYDKGCNVAHTLRNYIGDDLFFPAIKALLNTYKFRHISSFEMRDFLSNYTGIDLTDFFQTWVFSPGFPHFSVDSFKVIETSPQIKVKVWVRQKLNHLPDYANSNRLEITFANNNRQFFTDSIHFSGQFGVKTFTVPFIPDFVMADYHEKISDAITDVCLNIKSTGTYNLTNALCLIDVQTISDSAFIRAEHNWVAPDPLKTPNADIVRLSNTHYWKFDGIFPNNFKAKCRFKYNRSVSAATGDLDIGLLPGISSTDSLLLLYRPNTASDWRITHFTRAGTANLGYLIADTLRKGEYCFAIGKPYLAEVKEHASENKTLLAYPNPSNNIINFSFDITENAFLKIFTMHGKEVQNVFISPDIKSYAWNVSSQKAGTYIVRLISEKNKIIGETKVSVVK